MSTGRGKRFFWGILTIILGILFLIDVVVPDPLPFVDEVVTGLLTLMSAIKTLKEFWSKARPDKPPAAEPKSLPKSGELP
jgi:hypothetical protein